MKTSITSAVVAIAFCFLTNVNLVHGDIITADSVSGFFNTPTDGAEFGSSFDNIINGNGLNPAGVVLDETNVLTTTHASGRFVGANTVVRDNAGSDSIIADFLFNTAQDLDRIFVWNYTQPPLNNRGVQNFEIFINGSTTPFQTGALASADPNNHVAQQITLDSTAVGVTSLRFSGLNNFGGNAIGIDEVRFGTPAAIPEPGSLTLLAMATCGLFIRRRR